VASASVPSIAAPPSDHAPRDWTWSEIGSGGRWQGRMRRHCSPRMPTATKTSTVPLHTRRRRAGLECLAGQAAACTDQFVAEAPTLTSLGTMARPGRSRCVRDPRGHDRGVCPAQMVTPICSASGSTAESPAANRRPKKSPEVITGRLLPNRDVGCGSTQPARPGSPPRSHEPTDGLGASKPADRGEDLLRRHPRCPDWIRA
jgi:hypothetical protein